MAAWLVIGLLTATVHAAGIFWYVRSKPSPRDTVLVVEPSPNLSLDQEVALMPSGPSVSASHAEAAASAVPPSLGQGEAQADNAGQPGVIEHNGKVILVPASPRSSRPAPIRTMLATPVAVASPGMQAASPASPPASRFGKQDHAEAAKAFAYHHFRYKYKIGSRDYAVTSQGVVLSSTEEVPMWNRYRSTGEVGLEYYDNAGFRRTTRRFEVLTEVKDDAVQGIEITVK